MNQTIPYDVKEIPRIQHEEAMHITAVENRRFAELLTDLHIEDWSKPTDCTRWNARELVSHVIGSAAGQVSPREFIRQVRKGRPIVEEIGAKYWWDGMNELQVRERAGVSTDDLIAEWEATSVKALRSRTKLPRVIARLPLLNLPDPVGRQPVSYLFDIGFTRDVWMHRIDLARAVNRPLNFDADHDGRLLADIVAEWAGTHNEPFDLVLEGPAGGHFSAGSDGDHLRLDAVEFVRILAERAHGDGVLRHPLPL